MRRARLLAVCAMTLITVECNRVMWTKPGFNAVDWQRDNYECERDARAGAMSFGGGLIGSLNAQEFFNRCLVAHGYYQVTAAPPPPTNSVVSDEPLRVEPCRVNVEMGTPTPERINLDAMCSAGDISMESYRRALIDMQRQSVGRPPTPCTPKVGSAIDSRLTALDERCRRHEVDQVEYNRQRRAILSDILD